MDETDELRRLALQIAVQLPASAGDARRVLSLTQHVLDDFLVQPAPASAWARAKRLGWSEVASGGGVPRLDPPCGRHGRGSVAVCCLVMMLAVSAVGHFVLVNFGAGHIAANMIGVMMIALLYGTRPALASGGLACVFTNLVIIPPALEFSRPMVGELVGVVANVAIALVLPYVQAQREQLREALLCAAGGRISRRHSRAA